MDPARHQLFLHNTLINMVVSATTRASQLQSEARSDFKAATKKSRLTRLLDGQAYLIIRGKEFALFFSIILFKGGWSIFGLRRTKKAGKPDWMREIWINGWIEKGWNNSSAKTRKNFGQKKSVKNAVKVGPFSRKCPKNGHFFNNFLNFTPYILFLSNDFRLNRLVRICRFQKHIIHMRTIRTSEITVTPENQYWPPHLKHIFLIIESFILLRNICTVID